MVTNDASQGDGNTRGRALRVELANYTGGGHDNDNNICGSKRSVVVVVVKLLQWQLWWWWQWQW